jgi:hypothetical protein
VAGAGDPRHRRGPGDDDRRDHRLGDGRPAEADAAGAGLNRAVLLALALVACKSDRERLDEKVEGEVNAYQVGGHDLAQLVPGGIHDFVTNGDCHYRTDNTGRHTETRLTGCLFSSVSFRDGNGVRYEFQTDGGYLGGPTLIPANDAARELYTRANGTPYTASALANLKPWKEWAELARPSWPAPFEERPESWTVRWTDDKGLVAELFVAEPDPLEATPTSLRTRGLELDVHDLAWARTHAAHVMAAALAAHNPTLRAAEIEAALAEKLAPIIADKTRSASLPIGEAWWPPLTIERLPAKIVILAR